MLAEAINLVNTSTRHHANLPKASTLPKQSKNTLKNECFQAINICSLIFLRISFKCKLIFEPSKVYIKNSFGTL